jgi:hypothetical protein
MKFEDHFMHEHQKKLPKALIFGKKVVDIDAPLW